MAEVIGPNSYLPGASASLPEGTMCDLHPEVPAVARIVGECDSFGSELNDCCQVCVDEIRDAPPLVGTCEWCKTPNQKLHDHRDYEEGMCGRVYQVCDPCLDKEKKRLLEEFDEYEEYED